MPFNLRFGSEDPNRHVIFPNAYVWFVLVSALDIMLTTVIIHVGGYEANGLADKVIRHFDLLGLAIYKFVLVIIVVAICEYVGRKNKETARQLLSIGIMLTCMPVILALGLLVLET